MCYVSIMWIRFFDQTEIVENSMQGSFSVVLSDQIKYVWLRLQFFSMFLNQWSQCFLIHNIYRYVIFYLVMSIEYYDRRSRLFSLRKGIKINNSAKSTPLYYILYSMPNILTVTKSNDFEKICLNIGIQV